MHLLGWVGRCQELLLPGEDRRSPHSNSLGDLKGHAACPKPGWIYLLGLKKKLLQTPGVIPECFVGAGSWDPLVLEDWADSCSRFCAVWLLVVTGLKQDLPRALIIIPWHLSLSNSSLFKTSLPAQRFTFLLRAPCLQFFPSK